MSILDARLTTHFGEDRDRTLALLSDLAELLTRHGCADPHAGFSFHDPAIASLPVHFGDEQIRRIVERVAPLLLDALGQEDLRATAAFVLGKTHVAAGLAAILDAVTAPGCLPTEVARQCAFAFDALRETLGESEPELDLDAAGDGFRRNQIPWDPATRHVIVNEL